MLPQFFNSVVYQLLKNFNPFLRKSVTDRIWNWNLNLKDVPNKVPALKSTAGTATSVSILPFWERLFPKPLFSELG